MLYAKDRFLAVSFSVEILIAVNSVAVSTTPGSSATELLPVHRGVRLRVDFMPGTS